MILRSSRMRPKNRKPTPHSETLGGLSFFEAFRASSNAIVLYRLHLLSFPPSLSVFHRFRGKQHYLLPVQRGSLPQLDVLRQVQGFYLP